MGETLGRRYVSPNGSDRSPRPRARRRTPRLLGLGLVLATTAGCSSQELPRLGMPTPATEEGDRILSLWQGSWIAALAVGALVWGLIIWTAIFHRRSRHGIAIPPQTRYNVPIEVLYTVVPFIIIAVLFYFTARDQTELLKLKNPDETVNVVGRQWSWSFNYTNAGVWDAGTPGNPPTLYLPHNERVRFTLTSPDVIHSFWVPKFVFKLDVIPGRINTFELTPNKTGTFAGKCAELCGVDHSRMLFNVKVVSPAEYQAHMADLRARGQTGALPNGVASDEQQ
jgi:cytochrome c oxidase subunit II